MTQSNKEECFLPARKVWERYGITSMTLHNWLNDPTVGFPRPIYISKKRYWKVADLQAWELSCAAPGKQVA